MRLHDQRGEPVPGQQCVASKAVSSRALRMHRVHARTTLLGLAAETRLARLPETSADRTYLPIRTSLRCHGRVMRIHVEHYPEVALEALLSVELVVTGHDSETEHATGRASGHICILNLTRGDLIGLRAHGAVRLGPRYPTAA
jgi:hypothetical protein